MIDLCRKSKYLLLYIGVLAPFITNAETETLGIDIIPNAFANMMNPIADYCFASTPSARSSIEQGVKNFKTQSETAMREIIIESGDEKLTISKEEIEKINIDIANYSNLALEAVKKVDADIYCTQLGPKLLKTTKEEMKTRFSSILNSAKRINKVRKENNMTNHSSEK